MEAKTIALTWGRTLRAARKKCGKATTLFVCTVFAVAELCVSQLAIAQPDPVDGGFENADANGGGTDGNETSGITDVVDPGTTGDGSAGATETNVEPIDPYTLEEGLFEGTGDADDTSAAFLSEAFAYLSEGPDTNYAPFQFGTEDQGAEGLVAAVRSFLPPDNPDAVKAGPLHYEEAVSITFASSDADTSGNTSATRVKAFNSRSKLGKDEPTPEITIPSVQQFKDLSTTDVVNKARRPAFTQILSMKDAYLNDAGEREPILKTFQTVVGVALLTLSYLDKTVAAGLATVQQQAGLYAIARIMKGVGHSTAAAADRSGRGVMYDQTDAIYEACMAEQAGETKPDYIEYSDALPTCQGQHSTPDSICFCVAEQSMMVGKSSEDGDNTGATSRKNGQTQKGTGNSGSSSNAFCGEGGRSAAQMIFGGPTKPTCDGAGCDRSQGSDLADAAEERVQLAQAMYGDFCSYSADPQNGSEAEAGTTKLTGKVGDANSGDTLNGMRFKMKPPPLGADFQAQLFEKGLPTKCKTADGNDCTLPKFPAKSGILKCLNTLVAHAIDNTYLSWAKEKPDESTRCLAEASLGCPLAAHDIFDFRDLCLPGIKSSNFCPDLKTEIKRFSHAAAVDAFGKYHTEMMQAFADAETYNTLATPTEKASFQRLMTKVDQRLVRNGWQPGELRSCGVLEKVRQEARNTKASFAAGAFTSAGAAFQAATDSNNTLFGQ